MGQPAPSALVPKASWQSCVFVLWAVDGLSTDQASSALWKQKRPHAWASSLSLAGAVTVRLQDPSCCARCNFITTPGAAPLHHVRLTGTILKWRIPNMHFYQAFLSNGFSKLVKRRSNFSMWNFWAIWSNIWQKFDSPRGKCDRSISKG